MQLGIHDRSPPSKRMQLGIRREKVSVRAGFTSALPAVFSGKRYCFGESLARTELFLFLTTIMQNLRFKSPQSPEDIDVSPKSVGFATIPPDYVMSFLPC